MPLVYETDTRGRGGKFRAPPIAAPKVALPASPFDTQERTDGLHLVNTETGESFGIMASPKIAENQLRALRRFSL